MDPAGAGGGGREQEERRRKGAIEARGEGEGEGEAAACAGRQMGGGERGRQRRTGVRELGFASAGGGKQSVSGSFCKIDKNIEFSLLCIEISIRWRF